MGTRIFSYLQVNSHGINKKLKVLNSNDCSKSLGKESNRHRESLSSISSEDLPGMSSFMLGPRVEALISNATSKG